MIYNINKFRHYPLGRKFVFHADHAALLYLVSKQSLTGKSACWMLLLQESEFEIQHGPGSQHAVVDHLSRIENGEEVVEGDDDFLDHGILRISANDAKTDTSSPNDKWLEDMSHFLTIGLTTPTNANR